MIRPTPIPLVIAYADGARIDIDGSTIRVGGTTVADVDNSTRFVVNRAHDGDQCISTNNEDCDYTFAVSRDCR